MKKKIIGIILCALLIIGSIPATAFAAASDFRTVLIGTQSITSEETWTSTVDGGTITWDAESATLTLNNADLKNWNSPGSTYGIIVEAKAAATVTVKLIGTNTIGTEEQPCSGSAIYINTNAVVEAQDGAKLSVYNSSEESDRGNALYVNGNLTLKNGSMVLNSSYPALYTDKKLTIDNCAVNATVMTDGSAIFGYQGIEIKGKKSVITTESIYCGLICRENDITITDGADVTCTTTNDSVVYLGSDAGGITIKDASVRLSSNFSDATGLFVDNSNGSVLIENSEVIIETKNTGIYTGDKDVTITDSKLTLTCPEGNSINSWNKLTIEGEDTVITANSAYPMHGWLEFTMTGGTVSSTTTDGTAVSSTCGISVTGGSLTAKTTAAMSALYAGNGNIDISGANTVVTAESTKGTAIFARNGMINLGSPFITAKAAEGFAAIVARQYSETGTEEEFPNCLSVTSDKLTVKDADFAVTAWAPTGNTSGKQLFYSDSIFVTNGTASPVADLTDALQNVSVIYKSAKYDKVDAAIAKIPADLTIYTEASVKALNDAKDAVVPDKDITEQEAVDAYAKAIEDAVAKLEKKPETTPPKPRLKHRLPAITAEEFSASRFWQSPVSFLSFTA